MAKRYEKIKPDVILKEYWSDNGCFADLFNAVLFAGKKIIQQEELMDSDSSGIYEHGEYMESVKLGRDILKLCKYDKGLRTYLVLLGIENQKNVHYAMPLRMLEYDTYAYKKQYQENAKKYKNILENELTPTEFLSKMKKTDRFHPVISIVVYYGETPWDGEITLSGLLQFPEELRPFVNDYRMHLVEVRENNLQLHNMNNQNLFELFRILYTEGMSKEEKMQKAEQYAIKNEVDKSVILSLAVATEGKIDYEKFKGKEELNMCKLFDEIWNEGKEQGIEQQAMLSIFKVLSRKGQVPQDVEEKIHAETNMDVLNHWFDMALDCETVEEFANSRM